jgi:hypothetical protein
MACGIASMLRLLLLLCGLLSAFPLSAASTSQTRDRLNDARPLSEAEMAELLFGLLAGRPGVSQLRVEDGDVVYVAAGQTIRMGLVPLSREFNLLPDAAQRQITYDKLTKTVARAVAGKDPPKTLAEVARFQQALLPVLKNKAYIEQFGALARKQGAPHARLLHMPLAGDIIIVPALDLPKITRFLTVGEGGAYGMTDSDVFRAALDNLEKRVERLEIQEFGPVRLLGFGETDYTASLLLLPDLWKKIPDLPQRLAFTIPARDAFAFADADDPEAVAALREVSRAPDNGFPVSRLVYRLAGRGIEVMR